MNQEEMIRAEVERQLQGEQKPSASPLQSHLWSLGGGIAGGGAGYLAMNPIDVASENMKVNRSIASSQQKEVLELLDSIHQGALSWDDITDPGIREALQDSYEMNKQLLNNPEALKQVMGNSKDARVYKMSDMIEDVPGKEGLQEHLKRTGRRRLLPDLDVLRNPRKMAHPAISVGSLAGMAGGYLLADQVAKKKRSES